MHENGSIAQSRPASNEINANIEKLLIQIYLSVLHEVFNENYYMKYNERQYTLNYADCNVKDTTGKLNIFEF